MLLVEEGMLPLEPTSIATSKPHAVGMVGVVLAMVRA